jgi:hypothetical protein
VKYLVPLFRDTEKLVCYFETLNANGGAHSSVVHWGTVLQAGKSRVRFPKNSLDFLIDLIFLTVLCPLSRLRLLTEMSTRNLPGGKERLGRGADNLAAICEPIVNKMWEARRHTTPWVSTAFYSDSFYFLCL